MVYIIIQCDGDKDYQVNILVLEALKRIGYPAFGSKMQWFNGAWLTWHCELLEQQHVILLVLGARGYHCYVKTSLRQCPPLLWVLRHVKISRYHVST